MRYTHGRLVFYRIQSSESLLNWAFALRPYRRHAMPEFLDSSRMVIVLCRGLTLGEAFWYAGLGDRAQQRFVGQAGRDDLAHRDERGYIHAGF